MNAVEVVRMLIADPTCFKRVAQHLEGLPPDSCAARELIDAYELNRLPGWLMAYYLGEIGHLDGYETALKILRSPEIRSSATYAGVAIAKIKGPAAYNDLRGILLSAEDQASCNGAAWGIIEIAPDRAADDLIEAYQNKRLPRLVAARHIASLGATDAVLLRLLKCSEPAQQRLAVTIIEEIIVRPHDNPYPSREVATIVAQLCRADPQIASRRRDRVLAWAESRMKS